MKLHNLNKISKDRPVRCRILTNSIRDFRWRIWAGALGLAVSMLAAPWAQAAVELVNLTFDNGSPPSSPLASVAVPNDGTALDPTYRLGIEDIWEIPLPTNPYVDVDGGKAIKLSNSQMVEFDRATTVDVVKNNVLRLSMDFKVEQLGLMPNGYEDVVTLWSMQSKFGSSQSQPWEGLRIRVKNDNGSGRIALTAGDGNGRRKTVPMFVNVPFDTWYRLNLMLDINKGVLTANLDDRYFQLSLFGPFAGPFDWRNVLSAAIHNDQIKMRLGWEYIRDGRNDDFVKFVENQGHAFDGVMHFDNVIVHNAAPTVDHARFKVVLSNIGKGITDTSLELKTDYIDFLEYMVFALTSHYLDENTSEVDAYRQTYENVKPPLFSDRSTNQQLHDYSIVDRVMTILQHDIVVSHFNNNDIGDVAALSFASRETFPGLVAGIEHVPVSTQVNVTVNGSYTEYPGLSRHSPAHRPTGYWANAGHKIAVCILGGVDSSGMDVIVGAHPPINLSRRINRNYTIVTGFPFLDNTTDCVDIANPFGGGIYVRTSEGVDEGFVDVSISGNIVAAPLFDNRISANRPIGVSKTTNRAWQGMFTKPALPPWSDLESDNFMFTVPSNAARLVTRPKTALDAWDDMYDAVSAFQGRLTRRRAEYLVTDSTSKCKSCSGYWMTEPDLRALQPVSSRRSSGDWRYTHGLGPFNILDDPNFSVDRRYENILHAKGHNLRHPTLGVGNEEESKANIIKLLARTEVLGDSWNDALRFHNPQGLNIAQSVMHWMVSEEFIDPAKGTMQPRAYQSRALVKYMDLADIFGGWSGVGIIMQAFYNSQVNGEPWPGFDTHRVSDEAFADMAVEAYNAAGFDNPLPLLEFHGVVPSADTRAKATGYGLAPSSAILARLNEYKALVPQTKREFENLYGNLVTARGLPDVRQRFGHAADNWETKTVNGRSETGYYDLIRVKIDEIISTYGLNP